MRVGPAAARWTGTHAWISRESARATTGMPARPRSSRRCTLEISLIPDCSLACRRPPRAPHVHNFYAVPVCAVAGCTSRSGTGRCCHHLRIRGRRGLRSIGGTGPCRLCLLGEACAVMCAAPCQPSTQHRASRCGVPWRHLVVLVTSVAR